MCGICGIINFDKSPVSQNKVSKMMRKMKHRGPDDEGIFIENNIGIGFVRLSILDLSPRGHQPMFSKIIKLKNYKNESSEIPNQARLPVGQVQDDSGNGRYVIVHNGEVYNYIEIREELKVKGYKFHSNADTEVVLYSYIEWGESCLGKFNGMWAFAIFDREKKELFCSRDRYGIKPFYYYLDKEQFIFASEIPPILEVLNIKPSPNNQAIFDYLVFNRTDQTESTFFEGIQKLQHGHNLTINLNHSSIHPFIQSWYNLRDIVTNTTPFNSAEEYRDTFSSAVGLRLRSDVPVGVCLSGGLDSSSIVSVLLKDYDKKDLNTFSAVYGLGKRGDESEYIQSFNHSLHNMYYTTPTAETLYKDLESFTTAHGEPIPSTAPYAQYKVMELAKNNVVVTLDGQGADEQLAGYHYFFGYFYKDLLKQFKMLKLLFEIIAYLKLHKSFYGLQTFLYFLLPAKLKTNARVREKGYLNTNFVKKYSAHNSISSNLYDSGSLNKSLLDHFEYKLEHLLKWEDRNSMIFSLESRVPFLDHRVVEKTLAMSSDKIIKNGWTKHILRESMKDVLPEKIRTRKDKVGFDTPQDEWFRTETFQKVILNILNSESFKERKIIDPKKAKLLYEKHLNGKMNFANEIWKWIHLEFWFREFID